MAQNWKKYFRTEVNDNKNVHFCTECEYNTTVQKQMEFHVRKHMRRVYPFVCEHTNCDKAFKKKSELSEHKNNHKCGFGIDGMEDIGICGQTALKGHYEMTVKDNKFKYVCKWDDCGYVITQVDRILHHVHSQHVCPYRRHETTN